LWVVPEKFEVLQRLHPDIKWIVRIHSNIPFIANEGIAIKWLREYLNYQNVYIAFNSPKILEEMKFYFGSLGINKSFIDRKVLYLPNYYPEYYRDSKVHKQMKVVNISSFGSIRPLKNQLIQAFAAIKFAESQGLRLAFHINIGRVEQKGDPVLKNLEYLFGHYYKNKHVLVKHKWMPRRWFLQLCRLMDVGMQFSFSETFNIIAADHITQGIPVVGSSEIPWLAERYTCSPTDSTAMCKLLNKVYRSRTNVKSSQKALKKYTTESKKLWREYLSK
jgi:hypothetical protein